MTKKNTTSKQTFTTVCCLTSNILIYSKIFVFAELHSKMYVTTFLFSLRLLLFTCRTQYSLAGYYFVN